MPKSRRYFSSEEKASIVRRHLVDQIPISDLCDEYDVQPKRIHNWQQRLVKDEQQRKFLAAYFKFIKKEFAFLELIEPNIHPWVIFKPEGLPDKVGLSHCVTTGTVRVELPIAGSELELKRIREFYHPDLSPNMVVVKPGRSTKSAITIQVSPLEPDPERFEEQKPIMQEAITELLALYHLILNRGCPSA